MTILPTSNCLRYVYLILSVPDTSRFYQNGISLWLLKDVFYPGETIHGKMKATFTSQMSVRAIKIKVPTKVSHVFIERTSV